MERIDRREFLRISALAAAGVAAVACAKTAAPTTAPETAATATPSTAVQPAVTPKVQTEPGTGEYKEAPMCADLVKTGELPPIAERLPKDPYVVAQGDLVSDKNLQLKIGKYGGTMRYAQEGPGGDPHIFIGDDEGVLWAPGGFGYDKGFHGNVVKSWEVNGDNTVYTFHMREGLKWFDGEPVTSEDVRFAYEDVLLNELITPIMPTYLRTGMSATGNPGVIKIIDDFTFTISFDEPYGSFPAQISISGWRGYAGIIKPKHWLKQFHIAYTPQEELAPKLREASIPEDQWQNLFNAKQMTEWMWNITNEAGIGHPSLVAWIIKKVEGGVFTFERNPYYFKVDTEGNQLPYIDGIRSEVVQDKETLTARALMGDFDYLGERSSLKKLSLMKEKEAGGDIKVIIPRMHRLPINFQLNLTVDDPTWRLVTGDVRFRRALSLAINRPEILKNFYLEQFAKLPSRSSSSEYSVDKANALLDEMGMEEGSDGWRAAPNGEPFSILFEVADSSEDHVPMSELIAEYWKKVGINTTVKRTDSTIVGQRFTSNERQATAGWAHETIWPSAGWDDYLPHNGWGRLWAQWYSTGGEAGEEPPQEVKDLYDNHMKFQTERLGSPESKAALDAIYQSYLDNVWTFNVVEDSYYPTFVTTKIQNTPVGQTDELGIIIMYSPEQWYIE
jgi:peptide/nickel transport system substrate-binding protein